MRRFTADYLTDTRRGMWADRDALNPLLLGSRDRVLDVGCGTGELTRVLREEVDVGATVVGLDADPALLAAVDPPTIRGDATRLPIRSGSCDLVVCQALLVNLPDPTGTLREFRRASGALVAAIEPDNAGVAIESTVDVEPHLAERLRDAYITGIATDVTLGTRLPDLFADAGLDVVATETHYHHQLVEPPYLERDLESAKLKAQATSLTDARETLLAGGLSEDEFDALVSDWKAMGRTIIDQMNREDYRRAEVIPFHVTVGRIP